MTPLWLMYHLLLGRGGGGWALLPLLPDDEYPLLPGDDICCGVGALRGGILHCLCSGDCIVDLGGGVGGVSTCWFNAAPPWNSTNEGDTLLLRQTISPSPYSLSILSSSLSEDANFLMFVKRLLLCRTDCRRLKWKNLLVFWSAFGGAESLRSWWQKHESY